MKANKETTTKPATKETKSLVTTQTLVRMNAATQEETMHVVAIHLLQLYAKQCKEKAHKSLYNNETRDEYLDAMSSCKPKIDGQKEMESLYQTNDERFKKMKQDHEKTRQTIEQFKRYIEKSSPSETIPQLIKKFSREISPLNNTSVFKKYYNRQDSTKKQKKTLTSFLTSTIKAKEHVFQTEQANFEYNQNKMKKYIETNKPTLELLQKHLDKLKKKFNTPQDSLFNWPFYSKIYRALIQTQQIQEKIRTEEKTYRERNAFFYNSGKNIDNFFFMTVPKNQNLSLGIGSQLGNCFRPTGQCTNSNSVMDQSYCMNITVVFDINQSNGKPKKILGAIWWHYMDVAIIIDWAEFLSRTEQRRLDSNQIFLSQLWTATITYLFSSYPRLTLFIRPDFPNYQHHNYIVFNPVSPVDTLAQIIAQEIKNETLKNQLKPLLRKIEQIYLDMHHKMTINHPELLGFIKKTFSTNQYTAPLLQKGIINDSTLERIITTLKNTGVQGLPTYMRPQVDTKTAIAISYDQANPTTWTEDLARRQCLPDKTSLFCPTNPTIEKRLSEKFLSEMKSNNNIEKTLRLFGLTETKTKHTHGNISLAYQVKRSKNSASPIAKEMSFKQPGISG